MMHEKHYFGGSKLYTYGIQKRFRTQLMTEKWVYIPDGIYRTGTLYLKKQRGLEPCRRSGACCES